MKSKFLFLIILILLLALTITQCSTEKPQPAAPQQEPKQAQAAPAVDAPPISIDGKALFEERCSKCHNLERATSKQKNADEWTTTVELMLSKGAVLNTEEQTALINYLAKTYPK